LHVLIVVNKTDKTNGARIFNPHTRRRIKKSDDTPPPRSCCHDEGVGCVVLQFHVFIRVLDSRISIGGKTDCFPWFGVFDQIVQHAHDFVDAFVVRGEPSNAI